MADEEKKNNISPGEAVHDLTAEIKRGETLGWRRQGFRTPVEGRMENGERIITYTLGAPTPGRTYQNNENFPDIQPMEGEKERAAVRKVFDELETVIKCKFVELPPGEKQDADFRFFKHGKNSQGASSLESTENGRTFRDIVTSQNETTNTGALAHEILHMLGLSHPGAATAKPSQQHGIAGGDDPRYDTRLTAMSYNSPGAIALPALGVRLVAKKTPWKIAAADVETLKGIYGAREETAPKTFTADQLRSQPYLDANLPASLEISAGHKGELAVETGGDPDERFGKITGKLSDAEGKKMAEVSAFLTSSTHIKDVRVAENAQVRLDVTGDNKGINRLQGGVLNDTFTPSGGEDVLTGSKGSDTFILDDKSKFNNVITDWEAGKDAITLKAPIASAVLHARKDYPATGSRHDGTELVAKDAAGKPIASLFIIDAAPEQVRDNIRGLEKNGDIISVAIQPEPAATTQPATQAPNTPAATTQMTKGK